MRTLLPGYPAVVDALADARVVAEWPSWFGGPARLLAARHGALDLFVLDAPHRYARPGNPYLGPDGRDWPDNAERFAALAAAAARIGRGAIDGFAPDVIHAHDWQAALVPAYLRFGAPAARAPATVLTIHNLAFQGLLRRRRVRPARPAARGVHAGRARIPRRRRLPEGRHPARRRGHDGQPDLRARDPHAGRRHGPRRACCAGAASARPVPSSASSTASTRRSGIPRPTSRSRRRYDADRLDARVANKRDVEARFGLAPDDGPLVCMITRLTEQKGIDLVVDALDVDRRDGRPARGARQRRPPLRGRAPRRERPLARPRRREDRIRRRRCRIGCRAAATRSSCRAASSRAA